METLIKYLNYRLADENVKINIVRSSFVKTDSLWLTLGKEFEEFGHKYTTPGLFIEPEEVANVILALCSGLMNGVTGQVLNVDKGSAFADNIMRYYEEREKLSL
jgi:enoyl-[acyl-carrier-protein] reductase (NADH)